MVLKLTSSDGVTLKCLTTKQLQALSPQELSELKKKVNSEYSCDDLAAGYAEHIGHVIDARANTPERKALIGLFKYFGVKSPIKPDSYI